tara:strand:- start:12676 stop:13941 length:1266 start_codon:yes stop_codon:yes gene_type:complete
MAQNALQALERLIDYNIQSKRADVQEALAFMQFGMQKRAAQVKEFGIQMEVLGNANKQLQLNVANNFIKNSGLQSVLNIVPTGIKDADEAQDELASVVSILKSNKIGGVKAKFNDANANDIASALWEYKNTQDPSSIVNLANKVESMYAPGYKGTDSDKNLLGAFNKISNLSMLRQVGKQAKQSLQNQSDILKEQFQFARGDTKIQSGFGMFSKDVAKEFQSQKDKELKPDINSIADLIEKETEEPTAEISGERIYKKGYDPKPVEEILEDSKDVLTEKEREELGGKLSFLTQKQLNLQESLDSLVKERQEILDNYEEIQEDREIALKRLKYFRKIGDAKKILEASKNFNSLENQLDERYSEPGSPSFENRAYKRLSWYGERAANPGSNIYSQLRGSKSEQIVKVKQAIRELERQRNLLSP